MNTYRISPMIELACMFPPNRGLNGASTTLTDLASYFRRPRAWPSKFHAVHLICAAALERVEARGHGNKAARREAQIETAFESAQDIAHGACGVSDDELAEFRTEGRIY
jgi:hypothetical protein